MWDLIVSVPDHCLSFYFVCLEHLRIIYFMIKSLQKMVPDLRIEPATS